MVGGLQPCPCDPPTTFGAQLVAKGRSPDFICEMDGKWFAGNAMITGRTHPLFLARWHVRTGAPKLQLPQLREMMTPLKPIWEAIMRLRGLILAAGCLVAVVSTASAADFIVRPTEPYECRSLAAAVGPGNLWQGSFWGRKEVDLGFIRYKTANEHPCFKTEKSCRNWLYNMQSEYKDMVWSASCNKGVGR
jgi:hypothetical protein